MEICKFSEVQVLPAGQAACCECPHIATTRGPGELSTGTVGSLCPCSQGLPGACQAGETL